MDVAILEPLRAALLAQGPLSALATHVWERTTALDTWGSNAIEGNTLTLAEVESVVVKGISVGERPMRDVMVTAQHGRAVAGLMSRIPDPITVDTVRELHHAVFRGVLGGAGQWRRVAIHIKGTGHRPPPVKEVQGAMAEWEGESRRRCRDGEPAISLGAWMHHRFEAIHPFVGGNGQVGRLLLDLHLLKHDWPSVHVLPRDREAYIEALEAGNRGDLEELEGFL